MQHAMVSFLGRVVWPGVPAPRVHALRAVLHNGPFRLRTVEDLVRQGPGISDAVVGALTRELVAKGMGPLSELEFALWNQFIIQHCVPSPSRSNPPQSLSTPSTQYQPPSSKIRVM